MMALDISDLPLQYQQQALRKLSAQVKKPAPVEGVPTRAKYNNVKVERATIKFDSKKEAARFDELMLMQAAGEIEDLRLQVEFTLQSAYTTPEGERIRAIRYKADFSYYRIDAAGRQYVVEDVKSRATKTRDYVLKKKLMADRLGIIINEI